MLWALLYCTSTLKLFWFVVYFCRYAVVKIRSAICLPTARLGWSKQNSIFWCNGYVKIQINITLTCNDCVHILNVMFFQLISNFTALGIILRHYVNIFRTYSFLFDQKFINLFLKKKRFYKSKISFIESAFFNEKIDENAIRASLLSQKCTTWMISAVLNLDISLPSSDVLARYSSSPSVWKNTSGLFGSRHILSGSRTSHLGDFLVTRCLS